MTGLVGTRVSVPGNPWRCLEVGNSKSARFEITGDSIMEPYFLCGHMIIWIVKVNLPGKRKAKGLVPFFKYSCDFNPYSHEGIQLIYNAYVAAHGSYAPRCLTSKRRVM